MWFRDRSLQREETVTAVKEIGTTASPQARNIHETAEAFCRHLQTDGVITRCTEVTTSNSGSA